MRLRIDSIELMETDRQVPFTPGLNVITGPISTGKTTLLRLCRVLLSARIRDFIPEVRENVSAVSGRLQIGNHSFLVVRPMVSSVDALVDIAGDAEAYRLPVYKAHRAGQETFAHWLLRKLDLPRLEVPRAPSDPTSEPTPVTVNDYLMYSYLSQENVDSDVYGHHDSFKNIKRKYVFEIAYGLYDVEIAQAQEELRRVQADLRVLRAETEMFSRFLVDTPWENRARLVSESEGARGDLKSLETQAIELSVTSRDSSEIEGLRRDVQTADQELAELVAQLESEKRSRDDLQTLVAQLTTQSERLARAIVAHDYLVDYDFLLCPRCGAPVDRERVQDADTCYLCLQPPRKELERVDLVREQERVESQIDETLELVTSLHETIQWQEKAISERRLERNRLAHRLDFVLKSFVSDAASQIEENAKARAQAEEKLRRLDDYMGLFEKVDKARREEVELNDQKLQLEQRLTEAAERRRGSREKISELEKIFTEILKRFKVPEFGQEVEAKIDRQTYLPIVEGRRFDDLSSQGLMVLVNVAHAMAHQLTALELDLALPRIIMIDGLTSNIGHEGLDQERVDAVYNFLIQTSEDVGSEIQIIAVDQDVPVEASPFVRLRLSEEDRLIPIDGSQSGRGS